MEKFRYDCKSEIFNVTLRMKNKDPGIILNVTLDVKENMNLTLVSRRLKSKSVNYSQNSQVNYVFSFSSGRSYLNVVDDILNARRLLDPRGKIKLWKDFLANFDNKLMYPIKKVIRFVVKLPLSKIQLF